MLQDFSGHIIKNRKGLDHWAGLFEEWRLLNEKICRMDPHDAPYWYNELTNVSVLAGAAWRSGWIALSEIQTEKGVKHRPKHWGRADLFIQNDFRYEYIEAKYHQFNASSMLFEERDFYDITSRALDDARKTGASKDCNAAAVSFFAPQWTAKKRELLKRTYEGDDEWSLDIEIEALIQRVRNLPHQAFGWSFPAATRDLKDSANQVWPGVFMFVQNAWIR